MLVLAQVMDGAHLVTVGVAIMVGVTHVMAMVMAMVGVMATVGAILDVVTILLITHLITQDIMKERLMGNVMPRIRVE